EPPVHEIEMVSGLVDEQRSAVLSQTMPAPEIVGAVNDIEVPIEIDRDDPANLSCQQDLLDVLAVWRVAEVERDDDRPFVAFFGIEDRLALRLVGRQRLLGHDF